MEPFETDIPSLLAQFKHEEKQSRLKRRWLMGLPMAKYELKQLEGPNFQNDRTIPESLLREDDVYYDHIKKFVEKGFGAFNSKREHHAVELNMRLFDMPNDTVNLFSLLDDMTNAGLCHFAEILTGGSIKFDKTRRKMKKIIKDCLPKIRRRCANEYMNVCEQLSELLRDPHNFRGNCVRRVSSASQCQHVDVIKILDGLEDLPTQTLSAMHRKLRGIRGYMPQLQPPKSGWGRDILILQVKKLCMKMLSELGEGDELPEPLAKAMTVACLMFRLILGYHSVKEFQHFSPGIEILQNEIGKAICLLKEKLRPPELKKLQFMLDPNAELSNRSLRPVIRNLLTEYLFECSDIETIPECVLEAVAIINRSSRNSPNRYFSKEEIDEEVECVLGVSAQTKRIVWDLLPEHQFDQEFADAYIDDIEESDDDNCCEDDEQQVEFPQNSKFQFDDSNGQMESIGETNSTNSEAPASTPKRDGCSPVLASNRRLKSEHESMHTTEMDTLDSFGPASSSSYLESKVLDCSGYQSASNPAFSRDGRSNGNYVGKQGPKINVTKLPDFVPSNFSCGEPNFIHDEQSTSRNQYLAIQEASDETSMVAYHLIGCILEDFAQIEGLDLDRADTSYLRGYDSVPKVSQVKKEEQMSCEEDLRNSTVIQVLEEIMPSFLKSGKEKVKELMGLK